MKNRPTSLIGGQGLRVSQIGGKTLIDSFASSGRWEPAWFCRYDAGGRVYVGRGLVNGVAPTINGKPIGGFDDEGNSIEEPFLSLPRNISPCYVKLIARVNPDGSPVEKDPYTIDIGELVQRGDREGFVGVHALAVFYQSRPDNNRGIAASETGVRRLYQITHFDLQHRAVPRVNIAGELMSGYRHFFW